MPPRVRLIFALLLLSALLPAAPPQVAAENCRWFGETGHHVCGAFLGYWQAHGGLAQQGYPLSDPQSEVSSLDGKTYRVQVFERAVLEQHQENIPPYDVLLTQLGTLRYRVKYGQGAGGQQANKTAAHYFPETGHWIGGRFWAYWQAHGGLPQQGFPISEEFWENSELDGKPYLVQYFERAVFEYHPENAPPFDVLLTQLGRLRGTPVAGGVSAPPPAPVPTPASLPKAAGPLQKGVNYAAWWTGQYTAPEGEAALVALAATGANSVALIVTGHQDGLAATQIGHAQPRTPADSDLRHAIASAKRLGLKVMLKPHVDLADDLHWRGEIGPQFADEAAWAAWFASYRNFIAHYALLAQETGVELFCVGTELVGTSGREADWRSVVATVRSLYKGKITYAANWGGEEVSVRWWDALDYIGVDAYYPLASSSNPTVEEMTRAWTERGYVATLQNIAAQYGKPVILTEVGFGSVDGCGANPFRNDGAAALDQQEQADAYAATLSVFWGQSWLAGIYWWYWSPLTASTGPADRGHSPQGKPAEAVMRQYYGR